MPGDWLKMNDCCIEKVPNKHPNKGLCPMNGRAYAEVSIGTIRHHINESWLWNPTAEHFYFCDDSECAVTYFGSDGSRILKTQLRTTIGVKEKSANSLLCYCFGISKAQFERDPESKDFVVTQTKAGWCSCESSNPSGRCCLKDFPKSKG
jgi:Zinc binding domain